MALQNLPFPGFTTFPFSLCISVTMPITSLDVQYSFPMMLPSPIRVILSPSSAKIRCMMYFGPIFTRMISPTSKGLDNEARTTESRPFLMNGSMLSPLGVNKTYLPSSSNIRTDMK